MSPQIVPPLGRVFTRSWVVEWMLDLVGYTADNRLFDHTLVEPSCGTGAFVTPVVERFVESCRVHNVPLMEAGVGGIRAFDLDERSVAAARQGIVHVLQQSGVDDEDAARLAERWVKHADFLLAEDLAPADFVIGNPPYVRLEDIPPNLGATYRRRWQTMTGRADLYIGFFERGLKLLREEGRLVFICADRWMRNAYGRRLRQLIHDDEFSVDTVIRLHDTDCFQDVVSAYPAITLIRRGEQGDGVVIEAGHGFTPAHAKEINPDEVESSSQAASTTARVPGWFSPAMWPEGSPEDLHRLADYEDRLEPLEDAFRQTRVGIGVATGADQVFITHDADLVERERMLPLVMAEHITDGTLNWTPRYMVNPWNERGLVDLQNYSRLASYLLRNHEQLRRRYTARQQPTRWYKTIDRVHPQLTRTPKILMADMKSRMTPVVDEGEFYPHHNLYWITSTSWDLQVLAGLLLSEQAELFVRSYCVKMRGGTLRMQAQYLRRIRVPDPKWLTDEQARYLSKAYETGDRDLATTVATQIYD